MKCLDIQSIIKNYESYVINRNRPLALERQLTTRVRLVRATSFKLGRTLPLTQRVGGLQSPKLQATSKGQATSLKLQSLKQLEARLKPQAVRVKLQATSIEILYNLPLIKFYKVKGEVLNHNKSIVRMSYVK